MPNIISPGLLKELLIANLANITYIKYGICATFTAFLLPQLESADSLIRITEYEASWIAFLNVIMSPFGCLIGGTLMDWIGRRMTLSISFIPFSIAWIIIAFATSVQMFYIAMIFNGIASGMAACITTYLAEICTADRRGPLLSTAEPLTRFGILFGNIIVYWLGWRSSAFSFFYLSVVCFFVLLMLPESPAWLINKGQQDKALKVLLWLRDSETEVNQELMDLESNKNKCKTQHRDPSETYRLILGSWKPLFIVVLLTFLMQGTGFSPLIAYTNTFFDELNVPINIPIAVITYSTVCFIGSLLCPLATRLLNRRTLYATSALGMVIPMTAIATYEMLYSDSFVKPNYWVVPLGVCAYSFSCTVGVSVISFMMVGEVFRQEIRGIMGGISNCLRYSIFAIIVKMFPTYMNTFGIINTLWTFVLFSVLNLAAAVYILPETKGKTLNEIQEEYFSKKTDARTEGAETEVLNKVELLNVKNATRVAENISI